MLIKGTRRLVQYLRDIVNYSRIEIQAESVSERTLFAHAINIPVMFKRYFCGT